LRAALFPHFVRKLLDRPGLRPALIWLVIRRAKSRTKNLHNIIYDEGVWIYDTSNGYYAFDKAITELDISQIQEIARLNFLWGYKPRKGDVVVDIGAGVGEEALMFSRDVGEQGKVICIEGHPRTFGCLEKVIQYNQLANVTAVHLLVTEPFCSAAKIGDSDDYRSNQTHNSVGISVPATTVDAIYQKLHLDRVNFLKMNIEGAECLAMKGMTEALKRTEVLCISCHDFLALETGDNFFRTKDAIKEFLQYNGFKVKERTGQELPTYLTDQVWAYNESLQMGQELFQTLWATTTVPAAADSRD
jgi:FkbM family methyltransferase